MLGIIIAFKYFSHESNFLYILSADVFVICCLQSGETALHVAARYGNVDVVSYLCSIRANPDLADRVITCTHCKIHTTE